MRIIIHLLSILLLVTCTALYAEKITHSAIMSPGCSKTEIQRLAGDALKDISDKQDWKTTQGFNIKLDESKMTIAELTKKMHKSGCFKTKKLQP